MEPFTNLAGIEQFADEPRNAVAGRFSCLLVDVRVTWRIEHAPDSGRHPLAVAEHKRCECCQLAILAGEACVGPWHKSCFDSALPARMPVRREGSRRKPLQSEEATPRYQRFLSERKAE